MGPTNIALVKLLRADSALREATEHYNTANKSVRILERRVTDLNEKLRLAQANLLEWQAKAGNFELDVKTRDERIEKLRMQQASAGNNKEYQAFLTEINTEKVDKQKSEDEQLKAMEQSEKYTGEIATLKGQIQEETKKHDTTKSQLSGKLADLQKEIDRIKPDRDAAAAAVPAKALEVFERLVERYEGEAMAPIAKPNPRREEYVCTACNKDMMADVYNRLHSRDEVMYCPSCRRLLYIPSDLPKEAAVKQRKPEKATKAEKATLAAAAEIDERNAARAVEEAKTAAESAIVTEQPATTGE